MMALFAMEPWYILILYFAICAFLGPLVWLIFEKLSLVKKEKIFLYGPFSVLDGFGVLAIYFYNLLNLPLAIKIISFFFILVILEYSASVFLEKAFHLRLWNHKDKFNLNGRVSLKVTLLWFALMLFVVFIWQPFILGLLNKLPFSLAIILAVLFMVYLAIDLFFSMKKYASGKQKKNH